MIIFLFLATISTLKANRNIQFVDWCPTGENNEITLFFVWLFILKSRF